MGRKFSTYQYLTEITERFKKKITIGFVLRKMKVKQHGLPRRDVYSALYGNAISFLLTLPIVLNKKRLLKQASKQTYLPPGKIALGTPVFPYNKRAA